MKKVLIFIIIVFALMLGIIVGGSNENSVNYFEEEKAIFEESIKDPENNYEPKNLVPKENKASKLANKIDELFEFIFSKL